MPDEPVTPEQPAEKDEGLIIEVESAGKPGKPELSDEEVEKLDQLPPDDEITRYAKDAQKRIKSLHIANQEWRRRVVQSNRDVATATTLAEQLYRENQQLKASTARSEQALIDQALQRSEAQMSHAKQRFLAARAANDANAELTAQEEIARAAAESDRLRLLRTPPAAQGETAAPAAPPQEPPPPPQQPSEGTQRWMERNPWFGKAGEEEMTQFAYGTHNFLVAQGITEASNPKEYWAGIDRRLREKFPEKFQVKQEKQETAGRPVAVAGATRTNGEAPKRGPRHVTLTESQVRLARSLGLTNEQYAAQLVKDEGLQENSYHDIAIKR